MTNYSKIAKSISISNTKSYKVLLKEAQREVEYYKEQIVRYTKTQDLKYLTQSQECLEVAELAVSTFKNKLKE